MIDHVVLLICISIMFVLVLLVMSVIHSRLHWLLKASLIAITLVIVAMDYKALTDSMGWPVRDRLPDRFKLVSAVVHEPRSGQKGYIYVWYMDGSSDKPRSVETDYDKDMHRKMAKAMGMVNQGMEVYMGRSGDVQGDAGRVVRRPGEGKPGSGQEGQSEQQSDGPIDFLPPPDYGLPSKD